MKRIIRIPIGILLCPMPLFIGSLMWLWEEEMRYSEVVEVAWYLASGQWNKLPD